MAVGLLPARTIDILAIIGQNVVFFAHKFPLTQAPKLDANSFFFSSGAQGAPLDARVVLRSR